MSNKNKFTKSVMERLEQENKTTEETIPTIQKNEEAVAQKKESFSLSDLNINKNERIAKNKTFYLDEDVIIALQTAAKNMKMTDSKLANEILKNVLGI